MKTNTRFYIWCYGYEQPDVNVEVIVEVETRIPKVDLQADPVVVNSGDSTKLTWITTNTKPPCVASGGWSGNQANGGFKFINNITQDTVFTLTCPGYLEGTSATSSVTVYVKNSNTKQCFYPVPPKNCTYIKGPDYNPATNCGMILDCKLGDGDIDDGSKLIDTNTSSSKLSTPINNFCSFTFAKNLGHGNIDTKNSKDVSYMQSVLVDERLLPSSSVTGKFYSQTRTALINFQKKYKLNSTGRVDANTRVKLNELFKKYCQNS